MQLALSPCPNDTFIFYYFFQNTGLEPAFHDVEELNQIALSSARYPLTKLSFAAYFSVQDKYLLLEAGGAMGRGCGPILISQPGASFLEIQEILIPGEHTTAALLLRRHLEEQNHTATLRPVRYDRILPLLQDGEAQAGVIIHEDRFTYQGLGLVAIVDLGAWWEKETGCPIPLGCIALSRDLADQKEHYEKAIRQSIADARRKPGPAWPWIKEHAQALSDDVIRSHIELYVNDYSLNWGQDGHRAIERLARSFAAP